MTFQIFGGSMFGFILSIPPRAEKSRVVDSLNSGVHDWHVTQS